MAARGPTSDELDRALTGQGGISLREGVTALRGAQPAPDGDRPLHAHGEEEDGREDDTGGMQQRLQIARNLVTSPRLVFMDEPTGGLDVSVQAQILNLLKELQTSLGLAYLFITHNIAVVEHLAHEVAVMYLGRIVEQGAVGEILREPKHPYTEALLSAVPRIEGEDGRPVIVLKGDIPSPANPPAGCHFHPRCPRAMQECATLYPSETRIGATRRVCCHLFK